jgi:CelD/BcsL family acetyltransferase involved in cellulose biosynthesis
MIAIQEIRDMAAFDAVRDEWNALVRLDGATLPYARHEWIAAWWEGFGRNADLHVLLLRSGGEIVAAAPLMRSWRTLAGLPVRALHSVGLNIGVSGVLLAQHDPESVGRLFDAVLGLGGFDVLILQGAAAGTALATLTASHFAVRRIAFEEQPHGELFLDTAGGLEVYRRGRSSKFWSNARNRAKRLSAVGTVEFERARTPANLDSALEEAFAVSLRSWKGRRGTAIGLQEEFRAFFRALARRFGDVGDCEVSLLRLNGSTIAYRIGLRHRELYLECDIAFDEAHRSYSPGTLLGVQSNEALIAEGTKEINLGMAFSWKGEWSPSRRERLEWVVYPRGRPYALVLRGARYLQRSVLHRRAPQS